MLHTIDAALTQAATAVLFGSFAYFSIAFAVFLNQETANSHVANLPSVQESNVEDFLDLPDCPGERSMQLACVNEVLSAIQQPVEVSDPLEQVENDLLALYDSCDSDAQCDQLVNEDAIAQSDVPLPTIELSSLRIVKRNHEAVVKVSSLSSLTIPASIKRLRWNRQDVIRMSDLETIANLV